MSDKNVNFFSKRVTFFIFCVDKSKQVIDTVYIRNERKKTMKTTTTRKQRTECPKNCGAKNLKMNNEVYQLRRNVMDLIYKAHDLAGYRLNRVDVRITTETREFAGLARMSDNVIWINQKYAKESSLTLKQLVLHELCHAIFGIEHNEKCPLMKPVFKTSEINEKKIEEAFKKYSKK